MVVGSSLVTNLRVSRALTTGDAATGAGVAVGSMANGAGRATSAGPDCVGAPVSAGADGLDGAAVPQARIKAVTKAAKPSSHLLFPLFAVIMTYIILLLHNLLRSTGIIFRICSVISC